MDYRIGALGRILVIRFDDGDDFLQGLNQIVQKEAIRAGWFCLIGGLRQAEVVTGPKEPTMPPDPVWSQVDGAREVLGIGTVYLDESGEPKIHLHAALGHHGQSMTACVRKGTKTYLILECHLHEVTQIEASRPWFGPGGFNRLTFSSRQ